MSAQNFPFRFSALKSEPLLKDKDGTVLAVCFPFVQSGKIIEKSPLCCLSLKSAGSMRFRWNEQNETRIQFFEKLKISSAVESKNCLHILAPELIHSKKVFCVDSFEEFSSFAQFCSTGDAVLTSNRLFVPSVTVADCVPVYLYHPQKAVFAMVHSGWKGTGIVKEVLAEASKVYGADAEGFCAVIGPHIKSCCYTVDAERADYFRKNFGNSCIVSEEADEKFGFHLSLEVANLRLLLDAGVPAENIASALECTCCSEQLGSHRRETAGLADSVPLEERLKKFTVMAAFLLPDEIKDKN